LKNVEWLVDAGGGEVTSGKNEKHRVTDVIDIAEKIPASMVAVFDAIQGAARRENIAYFVVGATARDLMLDLAFQVPVRRVTRDIDIAIRVRDWTEYERFVNCLMSKGEFTRVKSAHRFVFRDSEQVGRNHSEPHYDSANSPGRIQNSKFRSQNSEFRVLRPPGTFCFSGPKAQKVS
jgi:hypothetical protein